MVVKDNMRKIIKSFKLTVIVLALLLTLFSCDKKATSIKDNTNFLSKLYVLRNPYTNTEMIINGKGELILKTLDTNSEQIGIIDDIEENVTNYVYKMYSGEKKIVRNYEVDGKTYETEDISIRTVFYDKEGKEVGLTADSYGAIITTKNKIIYRENDDFNTNVNYIKVFDVENKTITQIPYESISTFKNNFLLSSDGYREDSVGKEYTLILDKNFNEIKKIFGYSINYVDKSSGRVCLSKLVKNENYSIDGNEEIIKKYNYLDEKFELVYEDDLDERIEGTNERAKRWENLQQEKEKYEDKRMKLQNDLNCEYVTTFYHDGTVLFLAYRSMNVGMFDDNTCAVYNESFEKIAEINSIDNIFEEQGYIFADKDTIYNSKMDVVKQFDEKCQVEMIEKFGKTFFINETAEDYSKREKFEIYDSNFNVLFDNVNAIEAYTYDDYLVVVDNEGTKLIDKNLNTFKTINRRIDIRSWYSVKNGEKTFIDLDTGRMGIVDKNFNITIDNLKNVSDMDDLCFTYQDGFEYGIMDYNGNIIFSYSIFDTMTEDSNKIYDDVNIKNEYPIVDGSTANMPMMAQIRSSYLNEDLTESENNTKVTTTDYAWRNLIDGKADLLLVYEPSAETKKIIEDSKVKLKITPIGVDALVFIVNEKNTVNNLTTKQLVDIYSGAITNWKDLGGSDQVIEAYQRELNSGSQTLFLNLLMKDVKPVDAPTKYRIQGMDGLIETLASYNNSGNALGYSVFYYAKKMYKVPGLKFISVDGVMPSDESIGTGKYPFLNKYYLVIREDTKDDSETMKLYNYILSDKGKEDIIKAGYIPVE